MTDKALIIKLWLELYHQHLIRGHTKVVGQGNCFKGRKVMEWQLMVEARM